MSLRPEWFSKFTIVSCTILTFLHAKIWFQGGFETNETNSNSAVNVQQYHFHVPTLPDWWIDGPKLDITNCVTRNKNSTQWAKT